MKKIFLYVHDEKGYGHLSRMLKIYHTLCSKYDVCILLSGTLQITDSSIQYIQLPYGSEFESVVGNISRIDKDLKQRRVFLKTLLKKEQTFDLFLDYYPFGRHALFQEIDMMMDMAHKSGGKVFSVMRDMFLGEALSDYDGYTKIFSDMQKYFFPMSMKDILHFDKQRLFDYLSIKSLSLMAGDILLSYYFREGKIDKVLVFGDKHVYDLRTECPLASEYNERFIFLGYLLNDHKRYIEDRSEMPYVLISVGGNILDMRNFLSLLFSCSQMTMIPFKIIIGTMVDSKIAERILKKFQYPHMEFVDFSEDIGSLMQGTSVFIGGGGYGTCTDLIQYNVPGFLYLNYNHVVAINETEQYIRIKKLAQHIDIEYVECFTPEVMKKILQKYLNRKTIVQRSINDNGSKNLLHFLELGN